MANGFLPDALDGKGRRSVAEADIAALLHLCGWLLEPAGDAAASAAQVAGTLDALIGAGLPHERTAAGRRFDPAEVINFVKARHDDAGGFWRSRYVATGQATLARALDSTSLPPDLAALPPRRFSVEIRRTFDLTGVARDAPLRLRLPLPIADAGLRALAVEPIVPEGADHRVAPGRLEVRLPRSAGARVTIAAKLSFVAAPAGATDEPQRPEWLAPDEPAMIVTPPIRAMADRLAGDVADPLAAVHALYDHLIDGFTCGVIPYDRLAGADAVAWVLRTRWYDCRLGAALLVALCRARGIAARLVGGYLLWTAPTEHYWAEVRIPGRGWLPFDLLGWDLSAGGGDPAWRHLFAGAADYRMKTQCLPDIFTGAAGVAFPPAWHRLVRATARGSETRFVAVADGRLIYAEELTIRASEQEG